MNEYKYLCIPMNTSEYRLKININQFNFCFNDKK